MYGRPGSPAPGSAPRTGRGLGTWGIRPAHIGAGRPCPPRPAHTNRFFWVAPFTGSLPLCAPPPAPLVARLRLPSGAHDILEPPAPPTYDRQGVQELTILFLHLGLFHLALSMLSEAPWTHLGPRTSSTRPRYPRQRCPITSDRKGSCSGRMDAKVFWRSQSPRERAPPPRSRSQQPAAHPADAARLSRLGALPWPRRRRLAGAGSRPPDPPDPQAPAKPAHDHCVMFAIVTSQWF